MKFGQFLPLFLSIGITSTTTAREWVSSDGKKLEAEFVALENEQVKLKRATGPAFSVPLNRLSEADQSWVKLEATKPAVAAAIQPFEGPFAKLITGSWELSENEGLKFAFYGGKEMNPAMKYPLVLALHGRSKNEENGKQLSDWVKSFTKPENFKSNPCFVLAPLSAQPLSGEGMGWSGKEIDQVIKFIKMLTKGLPVDPARIYIIGHSMGGFGTCNVMGAEPRMFAAAIPVAGISAGAASELGRKPIWMFHAVDDSSVPVSSAREFAELLKQNKQFKYTESPTGGHGVVSRIFEDSETHKWLFAQQLK